MKASEPYPADGAIDVLRDVMLSWTSGIDAVTHEVYLGVDFNDVNNADITDVTGIYRGGQNLGTASYTPVESPLEWDRTYYWRIDDVNDADPNSPWKGGVWSFTTTNYVVVDDFEDYDIGNKEIWWVWKDGLGHAAYDNEPAYPGNGSGSAVGDENSPSYMEETIVHGGGKSLPFYYGLNNASDSWATRTFEEARDWTRSGVKMLVLYFQGVDTNKGGKLYVEINNKRIDYPGDASDLTKMIWTQWTIDPASENMNPQSVETLTIGVEGISSSGVLYIDDIRLYEEAPAVVTE